MGWIILSFIFSAMAGFTYGRLFGMNLILHIGEQMYPDFKQRLTNYVIKRDAK